MPLDYTLRNDMDAGFYLARNRTIYLWLSADVISTDYEIWNIFHYK